MDTLFKLVVVVQILSALVIIGLVLLQHGKGADMGAAFGSGASGSLFGATGSSNFVSKSTGVAAAVFMVCTLALSYIATNRHGSVAVGGSVMDSPAARTEVKLPASGVPASAPASPAASAAASVPAAPASAPAASSAAASASANNVVPK